MKNKQYSRNGHGVPKKRFVVLFAAVLLLICLVGVLWLTNVIPIFHKAKPAQTTSGPVTKGESQQTGSSQANNSSKSNITGTTKSNNSINTNSNAVLLPPTGDFVSDHHPNLSGSPAPNTMSSVCTTTPDATCTIVFTKSGVTKYLAGETTDSNGSAYWYWKLQDIGLTAGSWQIQATATLNSQTKTASDAMDLVVSQ